MVHINDHSISYAAYDVVKSFAIQLNLILDVHQDIHCGEETHIIPKILSHRVQMFQRFKSAVSEALVTSPVATV